MTPSAKVVAGYQPVMPTYQGQVSEEDIIALIAYIQSTRPRPHSGAVTDAAESCADDAPPRARSTT